MALIVGRPGSGCTTFLKALANIRAGVAGVDGEVVYGDMSAKEAEKVRFCVWTGFVGLVPRKGMGWV